MKQHYGTKLIQAEPMSRAAYNVFRGWALPANENGADEGYLVEYLDGGKPNVEGYAGYVSWSPKEQFENAYQPLDALSFGHAVEAAKAGHKITRAGWNGKGMFVYYVPANTYATQTEAARSHFGDSVPYRAYLAMKTVDNDVVPWMASQTDILANDWQVVDALLIPETEKEAEARCLGESASCATKPESSAETAESAEGPEAPEGGASSHGAGGCRR
jgi:hypothetical protein